MPMNPRLMRPTASGSNLPTPGGNGVPSYSPVGYSRLWFVTEKSSGDVTGTAASDTGYFAVKWWDNTTNVYGSGDSFSKAAAGVVRAFEIYPCLVAGAPSGQFNGFNVSNNAITQVRADGVSLSGFAPGQWVPGTVPGYTYYGGTYFPSVYAPATPLEAGVVSGNLLSASALDQFYTDLAAGGGDIYVNNNPGVVSDTPTIATAKGYTVFGSVYVAPGTALLLNFNGSNGSTTFTDSSGKGVSVTANGGVQISTATSRFGGSSVYFDGVDDYLRASFPVDWSGDFTVEFWFLYTNLGEGTVPTFFEAGDIGPGVGGVHVHMGGEGIATSNGITGGIYGGYIPPNTWTHIALVRQNATNTAYVGGTSIGSDTQNYGLTVTNNIVSIGGAPNYGFPLLGYMDDFRVVSGHAIYTANFTPPTAQLGVYP